MVSDFLLVVFFFASTAGAFLAAVVFFAAVAVTFFVGLVDAADFFAVVVPAFASVLVCLAVVSFFGLSLDKLVRFLGALSAVAASRRTGALF